MADRGVSLMWPDGHLEPEDIIEIERTLRAHGWTVVSRRSWQGVAYLDADPPRGPRKTARPPVPESASNVVSIAPRREACG